MIDRRPVIPVDCPADGRQVGEVPVLGRDEVAEMAGRLRKAQPQWETLGFAERAQWLGRWRDWMLDNERRLLDIVRSESGKSWGDVALEASVGVDVINYYSKHAEAFLADRHPRPHALPMAGKRLRVKARPHPLVGVITPWNAPLANPLLDVPAALMAGCAVLTKPSEVTPLSWMACVEGWQEIGAPEVIGCATGDGETGSAVVSVVDMVQFTGSVRTGRRIAAQAAERLIPVSLELGGKDAMIVLSDADLDRACAGAVWGAFYNAGQICVSVERVYVEAPVYDELVRRVIAKTEALRVGMDPAGSYATDIGAMATEAQLQIVERHVADALAKGARAVTGGRRADDGLFFPPTVLVDVDHSMTCMHDETFGPTMPIMRVADEHEAIALANDSSYGLAASVWSRDPERAARVADRLESGAVTINNAMVNVFQLPVPMGGWRDSGLGTRFGGAEGILKYCRRQTQVSERVNLPSDPHWYPYRRRKGRLQAALVRALGARDWRRRLGLRAGSR